MTVTGLTPVAENVTFALLVFTEELALAVVTVIVPLPVSDNVDRLSQAAFSEAVQLVFEAILTVPVAPDDAATLIVEGVTARAGPAPD